MAVEDMRRFLIAPRIRSRQADHAVRAELTRLGVDAVIPVNGIPREGDIPIMAARVPVTMRTRVMPSRRASPPAPA
jgi:hypothetical protein